MGLAEEVSCAASGRALRVVRGGWLIEASGVGETPVGEVVGWATVVLLLGRCKGVVGCERSNNGQFAERTLAAGVSSTHGIVALSGALGATVCS